PRGASAHVTVAIDGRTIDESTIPPGFFLRTLHLAPGAVAGNGYATITLSATGAQVAVEQFDAQSVDRVVFGFAEGWHEQEYTPSTGLLWRWTSERASLRVHAAGHALTLVLGGERSGLFSWKPAH